MTGHEILLTLRLRGQKPSDVFVMVLDTEPVKRGFMAAEDSINCGGFPEIDISSSDVPNLLDLRCLRGCGFTFAAATRSASGLWRTAFETSNPPKSWPSLTAPSSVGNPSHEHDFFVR